MKTVITSVIAIALFAGSSAFAQNSTGHDYSRTGIYKAPTTHKAVAGRSQGDESVSAQPPSLQYSRTGDYRQSKVVQQSGRHDERSANNSFRGERTKVVAPASAPNRFGTANS